MNEDEEISEQEELYEHHRIEVDKGQQPLRIDKFLMNRVVNVSRNRIQNSADAGCILVNEKAVKSNYRVKPGDVISVVMAKPPRDTEIYPENIPIHILYEDSSLLIVNKEAGMVVHPGFGNFTGTLVNALTYHFKDLPHTANGALRPGLVHRIDKNTSGLLVIAKTEEAMSKLAKEFFDHTIHRKYLALIWGEFEEDEGRIEGHIGRSVKDRRVMDVYPDGEQGKHAVTHYKTLEKFGYTSLIECRLETGRTHQIRAHMKYAGHPLFNDETYGGNKILKGTTYSTYKKFIENCFAILPRQALHAKSLGFIHPSTGKEIYFEAEPPSDFMALLEKWRNYIA
jgi:23S rRNA pseudouridine1911/1915/1917 synthase